MHIDGVNKTGPVKPAKLKKTSPSRSNFGAFMDDADAAEVTSTTPTTAVNPFFALQEVDDQPEGQAKQVIKRGFVLLDKLDEIRMGLLSGNLSPHNLQTLKEVITSERTIVNDQVLTDIIDAIEVRAAVELAKLERSSSRS